jgi:hypothetical protein
MRRCTPAALRLPTNSVKPIAAFQNTDHRPGHVTAKASRIAKPVVNSIAAINQTRPNTVAATAARSQRDANAGPHSLSKLVR